MISLHIIISLIALFSVVMILEFKIGFNFNDTWFVLHLQAETLLGYLREPRQEAACSSP